ncbi:MAG: hypothetical protein Q8Q85_07080 [Gemmatimonadales bacterium]|nr:hypothetical protein [Gemmatimonadales bacterium]
MTAWLILLIIFVAGCIGGITNAAIAGELRLPYTDPEARVYRPGWVGNVLIGGIAALVFWGLYGPMAAAVLMGPIDPAAPQPLLRVSELFAALLTGIGGGRLLTAEVERRVFDREKKALTDTKDALATAVKSLAEEVRQ